MNHKRVEFAVCILVGALFYYLLNTYTINFGVDWRESFYPAIQRLMHGANPYQSDLLFTPIWGLVLLIPFWLVGVKAGMFLLYLFNLFMVIYVCHRLRARLGTTTLLLLSPITLFYLHHCNIDGLVLLGLVLPLPFAPFLLLLKPQVGIGAVIYMMVRAWRENGMRYVISMFYPSIIAMAQSVLFVLWASPRFDVIHIFFNTSLYPWSVPVGAVLLAYAIVRRRLRPAILAGPLLSPYLQFGSWIGALISATDSIYLTLGATLLSWVALFLLYR